MLSGTRTLEHSAAPLTDVFGWLKDGGSARSEVLKHGDSLLHLALKCLCVVEPDDGRLVEPAVRVRSQLFTLSTNAPELPPCSSSTAARSEPR